MPLLTKHPLRSVKCDGPNIITVPFGGKCYNAAAAHLPLYSMPACGEINPLTLWFLVSLNYCVG